METAKIVEDCDELTQTLDMVEYGGMNVVREALGRMLQRLQNTFQKLLIYEGPDAQLRQGIQSGVITDEDFGTIHLSMLDATLIVQISDDLQLKESDVIHYLLRAKQEGSYTYEAAAGLYFSDRTSILTCLHRIFSMLAFNEDLENVPDSPLSDILSDLRAFSEKLLSVEENGHSKMIHRLVELTKRATTEIEKGEDQQDPGFQSIPQGPPSAVVFDSMWNLKPKSVLWAEEQRRLCETLLLAVKIKSRIPVESILELIDLMGHFNQRIHEDSGSETNPYMMDGLLALFSLIMTLLPQEMQHKMSAADNDETKLEELANDAKLTDALKDDPGNESFGCIVRFAWGILQARYRATIPEGKDAIKKCSNAGVLGCLLKILLNENLENGCQAEIHGLCIGAAHNLVVHFLEIENKNIIGKVHSMYKITQERMAAHWNNDGVMPAEQGDHLSVLLDVLAEIYSHRSDLILFGQPPEAVLRFIGWVPDSNLLSQSPEILCSFLSLWSGIATGEEGATRIHNQLYMSQKGSFHAICEGYEQCQWGFIIRTLIEFGMATVGNEFTPAKQVGKYDLRGLTAYLQLITKVFSEAPLAAAATWIYDLERDYQEPLNGRKITDVLIHLLCQPIPHQLKAALDETLVAFGRTTNQARNLLESLKQRTILRFQGAKEDKVDRYDLLYQLNQIEATAEEYPESLAFINLMNALMKNAYPVPDQATVVADCTTFVMEGLLPRMRYLKFQSPIQQWELLAGCFTHLRLAVENARFTPEIVRIVCLKGGSDTPPGYTVMKDILGGGRILPTIAQVLSSSIQEFKAEPLSKLKLKNAKLEAVVGALSLLRTVFDFDLNFLKGVEESVSVGGLSSLDQLLMAMQREELFCMLEYVSVPFSPVQAEAVSIARNLAKRLNAFMDVFSTNGRFLKEVSIFKEGVAWALNDGLYQPRAIEDMESTAAPSSDLRAALILRVLLENISKRSVNISHLLCGFDVGGGLDSIRATGLSTSRGNNCLIVILECINGTLSAVKPHLYVSCLEVIRELARNPDTAPGLISLLRSESYEMLLDHLPDYEDLMENRPQTPRDWIEVQSRACLLEIQTKGLSILRPGVEEEDTGVCREMLKRLFGVKEEDDSNGVPFTTIMKQVLVGRDCPTIEEFVSDKSKAAVEEHGGDVGGPLEILRLSNTLLEDGGIMYKSITGIKFYDYHVLGKKLEAWYSSRCQLHQPSFENAKEDIKKGCTQICSFAMAYNAHIRMQSAAVECLNACFEVISTAVDKRWGILVSVCHAGKKFTATQLLVHLGLVAMNVMVESDSSKLTFPVARLLHAIMVRLSKEAIVTRSEITDLMLLPEAPPFMSGLTTILRMDNSRLSEQGRSLLMSSMFLFLSMSRYDSSPGFPLLVQNSAFIRQVGLEIVQILEAEINDESAGMQHQLVALQTLKEVVSAEGSIAMVETLLAKSNVYYEACGWLKNGVMSWLVPGAPQEIEFGVVARLELIQEMVSAGGPDNGAEIACIMNRHQVIERVCGSDVFECLPEEWPARSPQEIAVFSKLERVVKFSLRIIEGVVSGLQGFGDAKKRAAGVMERYCNKFRAIMLKACSLKWGDWEPTESDMEIATSVVKILSVIGMENFRSDVRDRLHDGVNRAAESFCCLAASSSSPFVHSAMSRSITGRVNSTGEAIWSFRKELLSYYHNAILHIQVNRMSSAGAVDVPNPNLLKEGIQQSLLDVADLLKEKIKYREANGAENSSEVQRYSRLLDDRLYLLLNCCRLGIYALVGDFKRGYQGGTPEEQNRIRKGDLAQRLSTDVGPILERTLAIGPRSAAGFKEVDDAWGVLKKYVQMQEHMTFIRR
ncbi:hypothetical protein BSKO_09264 [Bryopsis sp. KO-2023]|nr:hypothetical protein BSKO_09264 [Bryopsis sp. KO-2023]